MIPCSFEIFLALSRSATCYATRLYFFMTNNHAVFHLWGKKNFVKCQKVSQNIMTIKPNKGYT